MIEFAGELTGESKRFVIKNMRRVAFLASVVIFLFFGVPTVVFAMAYNYLLFLFLIPISIVLLNPFFQSDNMKKPFTVKITIESKELVYEHENLYNSYNISDVEDVIEYSEFYHILFNNFNKNFVCQKDLLTKGTIEDFEALFEEKITRVNQ
ncbi:MAG: hypothetical protein IJF05_00255 [Clostridia bacterium]|nr:hypothetical protein [Clostridia bacterium]